MPHTVWRVWHDDDFIGEYDTLEQAERVKHSEERSCYGSPIEKYCDTVIIQTVEVDDNGEEWESL